MSLKRKSIGVLLFVFAGVILGISLNKVPVNPIFVTNPIVAVGILLVAFLLFRLPGPQQRIYSALRAAVFNTSETVFNTTVFVLGVIAYSAVIWHVFQATPHLDDSVTAFFHAKIFASGHLTIPLPERSEFFTQTCMLDARHGLNHMASMYPPGFPGIFVPALFLGIPWITNPILGGGLVVMINKLARELYDEKTGRLAAILALFSPFIVLQSGTYLSHVSTAFLLVLCMWAVCRLLRLGAVRYGFLAGLGFGVAFLIRPLTALLIGMIIALAPLFQLRSALRHWKAIVAAGLMAVVAAGVLALFQKEVTGDYAMPGHELGMGERGRMGFGRLDKSVTHTPELGWDYTRLRMSALNHKTLGWPLPLFLVALLPFLLFRSRWTDAWLVLPALALLAVYFTFWYYEWFYEARYIFSGIPFLLILSARGCACLKETFPGRAHAIRALVASCVVFQVLVSVPHHVMGIPSNHGDVEAVLPQVVESQELSNAIIFMEGKGRLPEGTSNNPKNSFYATGFMLNELGFNGDVIYARYLAGKNHLLAKDFPNKKCYLYQYIRPENKARLYRLDFDRRVETRTLVEPTLDTPYLAGEEAI